MGSKSDWPVMKRCSDQLKAFGIEHRVHVASAHRTPARVESLIAEAENAGTEVFIAAAGMAAHLAGAVAAKTTRPVIGVPMVSDAFLGLDATLSTVNMPPGIPVLTVSAGKAGATNAAIAAAQILATSDTALRERLQQNRREMVAKIEAQDRELAQELKTNE